MLYIYISRHKKPKSIFYSGLLPNLERQELVTWRFGGVLVAQGGPSLLNTTSVQETGHFLIEGSPESMLPRLTAGETLHVLHTRMSCTPCTSNEMYNYFPEIMDVMLFRAVKP